MMMIGRGGRLDVTRKVKKFTSRKVFGNQLESEKERDDGCSGDKIFLLFILLVNTDFLLPFLMAITMCRIDPTRTINR